MYKVINKEASWRNKFAQKIWKKIDQREGDEGKGREGNMVSYNFKLKEELPHLPKYSKARDNGKGEREK